MAPFLSSLRRSASTGDLAELRQLVARLDGQRIDLERLVQHADRSIAQLQRLGTLGERVNVLEKQLAAMERFPARLEAAEQRVGGLTETHQRLETGLAETAAGVERARVEAKALTETVGATTQLKQEMTEFLTLQQPLHQVRGDLDTLQAQCEGFHGELGRLRTEHDVTLSSYRAASSRIEKFEGDWQRISRTLTETEHRIAGLEQLLRDLSPVTESVAQTRRQLASAKATADQLGQKVQLLEQQRDQIDRAAGKLEHLSDLMQRADLGLERQAEATRVAATLRSELETLSDGQRTLHDQSGVVVDRLGRIEMGVTTADRSLAALRHTLDQHVERLAQESRSVDGVGQRMVEVRRTLAESEKRLAEVTTGMDVIGAAAGRAEALTAQVAQLGNELARVSDLGSRVRAGLAGLEMLENSISGLTERTCRVEESRPAIDRAMRDLGSLGATQEAIREALEQLRTAREELSEAWGKMEVTRNWLGETERSVASLRNDVGGLDKMRATVDTVRQEVDQLTAAMSVVEARRDLVEDVQRRLTEATGLGASMEEQARGLSERLEAAEDHLGTLIPRLDEVGRAGSQLLSLGADLREMEQRVGGVKDSVGGIEKRAEGLEALSEKMRELSREVDQRQNAVRHAAERLEGVTTLRQQAADAAQSLGERAREIDGALEQANARLADLTALTRELEGRTTTLQGVQERITGFEARLVEWRGVEQQLSQAIEQGAARQSSVAALQGEIRSLYEVIERTQEDARAVVEARPHIAKTRAELEEILSRLDDSEGIMRNLAERRRQLDRAEERLAHADTLLTDLRATLEILLSQKEQVDFFLEQASALSLEARQAESLLVTLREERRVSDRIRGALSDLKRRDEVTAPGEPSPA